MHNNSARHSNILIPTFSIGGDLRVSVVFCFIMFTRISTWTHVVMTISFQIIYTEGFYNEKMVFVENAIKRSYLLLQRMWLCSPRQQNNS